MASRNDGKTKKKKNRRHKSSLKRPASVATVKKISASAMKRRAIRDALARRVLTAEMNLGESKLKIEQLNLTIADMNERHKSAVAFVEKTARDREKHQAKLAAREAELKARERRLCAREAEVAKRKDLQNAIDILEKEVKRLRLQCKQVSVSRDELLRREGQNSEEINSGKTAVKHLESIFVAHLEDMTALQIKMEDQISQEARDDESDENVKKRAKSRLKTELKESCKRTGGAEADCMAMLAASMLQTLQVTYKKASDRAEELRTSEHSLRRQLDDTTTVMMDAIGAKDTLHTELRSEQLNVRRLKKRIQRLLKGEVGELRALLTHSVQQYTELYNMLKEYLAFSQEEMKKSLGFVPRMVVQVAAVCEGVPTNPLESFLPINNVVEGRPNSPPRKLESDIASLEGIQGIEIDSDDEN